MATVISKLVSARDKYNWTKWTDGKVYRARKGRDFTCTRDGFRSAVYRIAQRRKLDVSIVLRGDTVEFQFSKPASKAS